jgi:alkanesulfonate monooxygenase SsuD/methylene tetrahydromethanopterin reductase-like flavin-dependent oxidoreductase (luciferase family)
MGRSRQARNTLIACGGLGCCSRLTESDPLRPDGFGEETKEAPMKFGISFMPTHYSIGPTELAIAVEQRGLESLWFPEHTHIPTSRKSPFPGGELPEAHKKILDPFLALTAAAAVTRRIKLATGICLVVERDPIHNAKEVATLLSGGRFLFGIGGGCNAEEMASHGTVFSSASS